MGILQIIKKHSVFNEHTPRLCQPTLLLLLRISPLKRGLPIPKLVMGLLALLLILPSVLLAQYQTPANTPYPQLEEYLLIAADENPELRVLWHQYRAELEQVPQVGTLPDPELNIGYNFNPMMSESVLGQFSVSAMQMFPWFGTLESRREMQRASAESDYQRLNSRQLTLFREIQTAWFDLTELHRQISIAGETIELVRDLESLVEIRYETARTGQADLLRIQMEEQRLRTLIANLEDKVNPIRARFNEYLNRDPAAEVETIERIEPRVLQQTEDELKALIRDLNPEFASLDAREQMFREQRNLARLNSRPSFGVGIEVMGRDFAAMSMFPDSREMVVGMASIRIPLYRSRYSAQHRQATELLQAVDNQRVQTGNRLRTQLEEALELYRETERSLTLLDEELIPRANQALEILRDEYAVGNVRFDELLQIQRQLLDLELERVEVLVKQHKAIIRIETLVGDAVPYQREN